MVLETRTCLQVLYYHFIHVSGFCRIVTQECSWGIVIWPIPTSQMEDMVRRDCLNNMYVPAALPCEFLRMHIVKYICIERDIKPNKKPISPN